MARETTPSDLQITPRDRRFGRGSRTERWWMGGDPIATALYNALSATFPKGEAFFVESVRKFRDGTDPKLAGRDPGLRHAGSDAQPRAHRLQQARA
jgi:predicted metal-dependent hydrolase